jgi:hypothetical protein
MTDPGAGAPGTRLSNYWASLTVELERVTRPRQSNVSQSNRKNIAAVSAVLLWLALYIIVAVPVILDPSALIKVLPFYLSGVLLFLEPLICFWAYYQYRYVLGAKPKSKLVIPGLGHSRRRRQG